MNIFEYLQDIIDFSSSDDLREVASDVFYAIDELKLLTADGLKKIRSELDISSMDELRQSLQHLDRDGFYSDCVGDLIYFERIRNDDFDLSFEGARYHWAAADVIVGLMISQGRPDVQNWLHGLPYIHEKDYEDGDDEDADGDEGDD
jgi:hypothetical protein